MTEPGFPAYFAHGSAAARYAAFRPDVHAEFAARVAARTGTGGLIVDAGCGTGQSSRALAGTAGLVVGADPSAGMLAEAAPHPQVRYVRGRAEALPIATGVARLVVAALAFHWFDAAGFMAEARRVLRGDGSVVVYASWFTAELAGQPGFREWFTGTHLARHPTPPRNREPLDAAFAARHGFSWDGDEAFDQEVWLDHDPLVGYLLTQSNVIASVEHGTRRLEEVADELAADTRVFLPAGAPGRFRFGGRIAYLSIA